MRRAARLPFFAFRFLEIMCFCVWFIVRFNQAKCGERFFIPS
jgi:hypothetical protein